jgi:hypothetical protein
MLLRILLFVIAITFLAIVIATTSSSTQSVNLGPHSLPDAAKSNFICSKYLYYTTEKPLISIVTRTYKRPNQFLKNLQSCESQIAKNFEHVILRDTVGSGMLSAETALYAFQDQYLGEYVVHMDSDDCFISDAFTLKAQEIICQFRPSIIVFKVWYTCFGANNYMPTVWRTTPQLGQICTCNVLVRKDVYSQFIANICQPQNGDFAYISSAMNAHASGIYWDDNCYALVQKTENDEEFVVNQTNFQCVTVTLQGGLGNQMFQIATALQYAKSNHKIFVMDTNVSELRQLSTRKTYWGSVFNVQHADNIETQLFQEIREPGFAFSCLQELDGFVKLTGYFQSARYFDNIRDEIVSHFVHPISESLDKTSPTVSLHIRRTDYIGLNYYACLTKDYYQSALNHIRNQVPDFRVVIFSDDLEWVKNTNWFANENLEYVDRGSDYEQLILMSQCEHHVMANSSFSWWAVYLGNQNGIVIAPKAWFTDPSIDTSDLYLSNWARL